MATLSIFANFYINDEERFLRVKDSFLSFKDIEAENWVINVRGKFKHDLQKFLRDKLGSKLIPHELESEDGWFCDTEKMLKDIRGDFVLLWLEDHINMTDVGNYGKIINDMKSSGAEYMTHSWWFSGKPLLVYKDIEKKELETLYSFDLTKSDSEHITEKHSMYIISLLGIFSNSLFKRIITTGPPLFRVYPKKTPLDFEKGGYETEWLPLKYAIPKFELFASIDDGGDEYSLQGRGLYPKREVRLEVSLNSRAIAKGGILRKIKNYIPNFMYKKLVRIITFWGRFFRYISLLQRGL